MRDATPRTRTAFARESIRRTSNGVSNRAMTPLARSARDRDRETDDRRLVRERGAEGDDDGDE